MSNKSKCLLLATIFCFLVVPNQSFAADKPNNEKIFLQYFYDHCYNNINELDKISAASKAFHWQEIPQDTLPMLGKASKGWLLMEGDFKMMLSTSTSELEGKPVNACTLSASNLDTEHVYDLLEKDFKLTSKAEQNDVYQKVKLYQAEKGLITGSTMLKGEKDTIVLSIVNQ